MGFCRGHEAAIGCRNETAAWSAAGINMVVSLLEAEEEADLLLEGEALPPPLETSTSERSQYPIAVYLRHESRSRTSPLTS